MRVFMRPARRDVERQHRHSIVLLAKSFHEKALCLYAAVPSSRTVYISYDHFGRVRCCVRGALVIRLWRQYMAGMVRAGDACPDVRRILQFIDQRDGDWLSRRKESGDCAGV